MAELNPSPANGKVNCLKYEFEYDHNTDDSHPNTAANEYVGPMFAQFIVNTIENEPDIKVSDIEINTGNNQNTITTDKGTLQLNTTITPANASNQSIIWTLQNGTGEATISSTGLVTAAGNGTVTATASANDGSGVSASITITISNQAVPSALRENNDMPFEWGFDHSQLIIKTGTSGQFHVLLITDLQGKQLFTRKFEQPSLTLDFSSLPAGIYIASFVSETGKRTYKIAKP